MNKAIFLGRFVRSLEIRYSQSAEPTAILKNCLAVPRKKKDEVDFINVTAFGKTAENINTYFQKGDQILIECHVQIGSYDDGDGKKVPTADFIIDGFDFTAKKRDKTDSYKKPEPVRKPENTDGFYSIDESIDDDDLPF